MLEQMNSLLLHYRCHNYAYCLKTGLILTLTGLAILLAALTINLAKGDTPLPFLVGLIGAICAGSGAALLVGYLRRYANYPALQELRWNRRRIAHSVLFSIYCLLTYRQHPAPPIRHLHPDAVMTGLAEPATDNKITALCDRRTALTHITTDPNAVTCRPCRAIGKELTAVHNNWLRYEAQYMS